LRLQLSQLPAIHCHVCNTSPFSIKAHTGAFDRQSATPRQSSRCSTCPTSHVSITRTAIAQHCTSARLTLVKHGLALVLSVHFDGLEPRDAVLELGARFIHACTRIARDRLAKPVHNVTKCSRQWRSSGARRQKYTFSSGGGGVTASARTCNQRTTRLSGIPIEDRVLQSGYRHCGAKTDRRCRIT
jgi:hypothetical protein